MMDLTAPLRFSDTDGDTHLFYTLVSVCMVSKPTYIVPMDSKNKGAFLLALNVLFGEVGLPTKI